MSKNKRTWGKFKREKKGDPLKDKEGLDKCPSCGSTSVTTKCVPNRKPGARPVYGDKRTHHCLRNCGFHSEAVYKKGRNPTLTEGQQAQVLDSTVACDGYWEWAVQNPRRYKR